jgi:hypothetical protein
MGHGQVYWHQSLPDDIVLEKTECGSWTDVEVLNGPDKSEALYGGGGGGNGSACMSDRPPG